MIGESADGVWIEGVTKPQHPELIIKSQPTTAILIVF